MPCPYCPGGGPALLVGGGAKLCVYCWPAGGPALPVGGGAKFCAYCCPAGGAALPVVGGVAEYVLARWGFPYGEPTGGGDPAGGFGGGAEPWGCGGPVK